MKMINSYENNKNSTLSGKRKPLQLLTGIFSRRNRQNIPHNCITIIMQDPNEKSSCGNLEERENDMWSSSEAPLEPREALHSPYHARTIDQDMENLRLSRQDNPYLQVLASRECLNDGDGDGDDSSEYEEKHLMSKENLSGSRDPLTLAEVHARLVRSPPPIMWTKGRNSEPSFSRLTSRVSVNGDDDCVFQFPPLANHLMSPTNSCRSHHSGPPGMSYKFLAPFDYNSRIRDSNLEAVTGKFNLSPQPRRRPESKNRAFSTDLMS